MTEGYPKQWEADVLASDGGVVHLRPIRPADADRIVALHSRMSERTRYLRYFGAYPRIPDRDLHRFTHVDHVDRVAFVAELGADIIAVGRYDRTGPEDGDPPDSAEVAFVVEDAHQGRGIGSVLLEHLTAAARERGILLFTAYVLAENPRMVRVFLDAGYQVEREYDSGLIHLTFPVEPTAHSTAVVYERERRAESRSIERLLTPRSVAVIGASNDPAKVGHAVFRNLLDFGPRGPVYPVNAEAPHVAGVRAYPTVLDVPDDVDLAVLAVPAAAVPDVVAQCAAKRVRALVVVSSGFGETGAEGRRAERDLVAAARANGMRVVGPNCLGVVNTDPSVRLNATLAPLRPGDLGRGRVGFFCQSGALGVTILQKAAERGLGFTAFVSAGNRADVSGNDLMQFWESDPDTDVVLLYLETFGNPRKFARVARRLARTKPVVAVKSGRRGAAVSPAAAASYAAPVPDAGVPALFEASGVIRVDTVAQLFDVAQLLAYQPLPAGPCLTVVTNSSALGGLTADAGAEAGLEVTVVDVRPEASAADFAAALGSAGGDALLVVFVPPLAVPGDDVAREVAAAARAGDRPVLAVFLATEGVPSPLRTLGRSGTPDRGSVPSYPAPERAVQALAHAVRYAAWRARPVGELPQLVGVDEAAARSVVAAALPDGRDLTPAEVDAVLGAYGLGVWPTATALSARAAVAAAASLGYPVAVKSSRRGGRRRGDLGGTVLDVADEAGLRAACETLYRYGGGPHELVLQRMAPGGVACVAGLVDDPSFGALVSFGIAGVAVDLLGDRAYAAAPLSDADAARLVRAPKAAPLLTGYRGADPVDLAAVEDLLLKLSRLADDLPEVLAAELTLLVGASGLAVLAAEARVGPPTSRAPVGPRRLRSL